MSDQNEFDAKRCVEVGFFDGFLKKTTPWFCQQKETIGLGPGEDASMLRTACEKRSIYRK